MFRKEAQPFGQARLEVRSGEIHAQIQGLDLSGFKQGLIIGGVEAVGGDVALDQCVGIRQVHDGLDVAGLGQRVRVGGTAQLIVDGAAAAEKSVFPQVTHCHIAEVGEYCVGGVVRPVVGPGELMDEILVIVTAGLLHGEGDGDVLQRLPLGEHPGVGAVFRGNFGGKAAGGGEISHVDGGDQHALAVPQHQRTGIHIGVVGAKGHFIFRPIHGETKQVTIGVAALFHICRVNVQNQVAVLLNFLYAALQNRIGGLLRCRDRQRQAENQRQGQEQGSRLFHTHSSCTIFLDFTGCSACKV